jgi:AcrR family transcriptional regulator
MARPKKTQVLEEFRVQSIREAAARVVAREGVAGATMQGIADEAELAKGTLYLYFKDRDALLASVGEDAFVGLLARVKALLSQKRPFEELLRELVEMDLRFFDENTELFRFYHEMIERNRGARKHRECSPTFNEYIDTLTRFMEKAMKRREIRRRDPQRPALFVAEGIVSILVRRLSEGSSPPIEDDIDLIAGTVLHGVHIERSRD